MRRTSKLEGPPEWENEDGDCSERVEARHECAALGRIAHLYVGRPAAQLLERLALFAGLAELAVFDRGAKLTNELAWDSGDGRALGGPVDDQAGDALAGAAAHDLGLVGVDDEALGRDHVGDRSA